MVVTVISKGNLDELDQDLKGDRIVLHLQPNGSQLYSYSYEKIMGIIHFMCCTCNFGISYWSNINFKLQKHMCMSTCGRAWVPSNSTLSLHLEKILSKFLSNPEDKVELEGNQNGPQESNDQIHIQNLRGSRTA